jgi:hypothetical protein
MVFTKNSISACQQRAGQACSLHSDKACTACNLDVSSDGLEARSMLILMLSRAGLLQWRAEEKFKWAANRHLVLYYYFDPWMLF